MKDYRKTKKKIFPLKVSDAFYSDLRYVAQHEGVPVSAFVRSHLEPIVAKELKKMWAKRMGKKMTFTDLAQQYTWSGKTYFEDKSVDEILYGGKLHEDEK
ncbi:MAG: hypothetical protein A2804_02800 [Candidatus Pacebacteria bacterium RIFCSPHIGHO2_01_FULL_46_10]|nr:MAG: hypothetical protein A2804_02800 [Candidatus Pacebacteria bacterium RIFCSPHIGHO2_01_FULL_46_10]